MFRIYYLGVILWSSRCECDTSFLAESTNYLILQSIHVVPKFGNKQIDKGQITSRCKAKEADISSVNPLSLIIRSLTTDWRCYRQAWFKRRILHAPNRIGKLNACKMPRLNQLNATYFNSTEVR